jgi:hypothetical protein
LIYSANNAPAADIQIYMFHKGYMHCHGEVTNLATEAVTRKEITGLNTYFVLHQYNGTSARFRLRLRGILQIVGSGVIDPWGGFWVPAIYNPIAANVVMTVESGSYATWQKAA